ncbi:MAG: hypothetical protein HYY37_02495 [Candidatus Aenigmarchaeota archaeon]|nr:hypothetical protein [Candidatus Aenigmarchaeota archaeon]
MEREEMDRKRKEQWIEAWFSIEAFAFGKETVEGALKDHMERLGRAKDVAVYRTSLGETVAVDVGDKKGFSQIAEASLFAKDLFTLFNIIMVYGPSAVEILGPSRKEITIDELQTMANTLAGVVHQFAAAGAGGIVISPGKQGYS